MKLTIGMACHQDYSGVFMTVNSLRHYQDLSDCEVLVVDNAPNTKSGQEVKTLIENASDINGRYVAFDSVIGAANAKNAVVENARGNAVLVVDCHVLLQANSIRRLKDFYDQYPLTESLYQGPLITHSLESKHIASHLAPGWGSGMFGKWSAAWYTDMNDLVYTEESNGFLDVKRLMSNEPIAMPLIKWDNHEEHLLDLGWQLAIDRDAPFVIPAQGMGLFSCRRDAWLGFNENFREFGGEEYYLQDKYRHNGRNTYCLPWLKWHHRFYRDSTSKYPRSNKAKFRNFVIGYEELGKDKTELVEHFRTVLSPSEIEEVLADPLKYEKPSPPVVQPPAERSQDITRENLFDQCQKASCGIEFYAKHLKNIAAQCDTVTEITNQKESSVFLLAGNPKHLISYQEESHPLLENLKLALSRENYHPTPLRWTLTEGKFPKAIDIKETDLLLINVEGSCHRVDAELKKNASKVRKFIAISKTTSNGYFGEDKLPGLRTCITKFLKENPEWFVFGHHIEQVGFVVLSKDESLRPAIPIHPWGVQCGVGSELSELLKRFGYKEEVGCSCKSNAKKMDAHGPEWCLKNIDTIVGWLRDEHKRRKSRIPFIGFIAKMFIRRAVRNVIEKQSKGLCD